MARPIKFGEIPGIEENHYFKDRKEMMATSFHRRWGAGIDGNKHDGTSAIVLSGGYEDDQDLGDEIIYTGAGGNKDGIQIEDQTWENHGNAGLIKNMNEGLPVRVIRGNKHKSDFSPQNGYVYAGLYSVVDAWEEIGKSGFKICRFRLIYSGSNIDRKLSEEIELDYSKKAKKRKAGTVLRIIRDTKISRDIKKLYKFECQICNHFIKTKNGLYAEGAHIKPIGNPHDGDDSTDNILCLCPNHHVMFDKGGFSINDNFDLIGDEAGKLAVHEDHIINIDNIRYHRGLHGYN